VSLWITSAAETQLRDDLEVTVYVDYTAISDSPCRCM